MKVNSMLVPATMVFLGLMVMGSTVAQCLAETQRNATSRDALASVKALNHAWNLENNGVLRSNAFAEKADQEGYAPVGSLFRALAQSQRIHARNIAAALTKLGWQPATVSQTFSVGSTAENLRAEINLHSALARKGFPTLLADLKHENFTAALRSVSETSRSEASYGAYLQYAAEHLEKAQKQLKTTYYVCKQCGYMTKSVNFHVCKVCYHFREKHEAVS